MKIRRGGQATSWPWWSVDIAIFGVHLTLIRSRVKPSIKEKNEDC